MLEQFRGKAANGRVDRFAKSETDFRKQLKWLIHNPPEGSAPMKITPEMAGVMLERNEEDEEGRNRRLSKSRVTSIADDIRRSEWIQTGHPIVFGANGKLLDGQHRLYAIMDANRAVTADVRFGVDPQAFFKMDQGGKRTAGDIFSIAGVPNSTHIAAATKWVRCYQQFGEIMEGPTLHCSPKDLYRYYCRHKDLQESLTAGKRFGQLASPSLMTALHYLCSEKNADMADVFFEQMATGIGLTSGREPIAKLRKKLIEMKTSGVKVRAPRLAAYTIMAWNATRRRKKLTSFRWRTEQSPNEAFPEIL